MASGLGVRTGIGEEGHEDVGSCKHENSKVIILCLNRMLITCAAQWYLKMKLVKQYTTAVVLDANMCITCASGWQVRGLRKPKEWMVDSPMSCYSESSPGVGKRTSS